MTSRSSQRGRSFPTGSSATDKVIAFVKDILVEIPEVGRSSAMRSAVIRPCYFDDRCVVPARWRRAGALSVLLIKLAPRLATGGGWVLVVGAYNNIGRYIVGATAQSPASRSASYCSCSYPSRSHSGWSWTTSHSSANPSRDSCCRGGAVQRRLGRRHRCRPDRLSANREHDHPATHTRQSLGRCIGQSRPSV